MTTVDSAPNQGDLGSITDWLPQQNTALGNLDSWLSGAAGDTGDELPMSSEQTVGLGSVSDWLGDGDEREESPPLASKFQPLPKHLLSESAPFVPPEARPAIEETKRTFTDRLSQWLNKNKVSIISFFGVGGSTAILSSLGIPPQIVGSMGLGVSVLPLSALGLGLATGKTLQFSEMQRLKLDEKIKEVSKGKIGGTNREKWEGRIGRWLEGQCSQESVRSFAMQFAAGGAPGTLAGTAVGYGLHEAITQAPRLLDLIQERLFPQPQPKPPGVRHIGPDDGWVKDRPDVLPPPPPPQVVQVPFGGATLTPGTPIEAPVTTSLVSITPSSEVQSFHDQLAAVFKPGEVLPNSLISLLTEHIPTLQGGDTQEALNAVSRILKARLESGQIPSAEEIQRLVEGADGAFKHIHTLRFEGQGQPFDLDAYRQGGYKFVQEQLVAGKISPQELKFFELADLPEGHALKGAALTDLESIYFP